MFDKHLISVLANITASLSSINDKEKEIAIDLIRSYKRIVICSMGKPAFACAKVIYTAHSFGLDWIELDATHAFHGDLGVVRDGDLIVIVSKSGETKETNEVAKYLNDHIRLAITSGKNSTLSDLCEYTLNIPLDEECSPFGYAPMASTTLYMIILHALMCEAVEANNCTIEQYARNHPNGEIGEKLNILTKGEVK